MRRLARLLVAVAVTGGALSSWAAAVGADGAPEYATWSEVNQSSTLPVGATAPPAAPAPGDGIAVSSDPSGPSSVAAIRTAALDGATVKLTLSTQGQPVELAPGNALTACLTAGPWQPVLNGDWASRPNTDCASHADGAVDPSGTKVLWTLGPEFVRDGKVDVTITLTGSPASGAVTFAAPDASAVVVEGGTSPSEPDAVPEPSPTVDTSPALSTAPGFDASALSAGSATSPLAALTTPTSTAAPAPVRRPVVPVARPAARVAPFKDTSRRERVMAVSVLLAILAALWWLGGMPQRAPRLLGSVGGNRPVLDGPAPRIGGIGRFARVRVADPNRLL